MRKRTVNHIADTIFWYLLYFLPILLYLVFMICSEPYASTDFMSFNAFLESVGFGFVSDNVLLTTFADIFGANGIMPIFSTDLPFVFFTWFIGTYLLHLCVDFVLFIPRLAHKWLKKTTESD